MISFLKDHLSVSMIRSRLGTKFLLYIMIAGIIPILVFAVPLYYTSVTTMEERSRNNLKNYSQVTSGHLFQIIRSTESEIKQIAENIAHNRATNTTLLNEVRSVPFTMEALNSSNRPWDRFPQTSFDHLKSGGVTISPAYSKNGHTTVSLLIRRENGEVLIGGINPERLWEATRTSFLNESDFIVVTNHEGTVLNTSHPKYFQPMETINLPSHKLETQQFESGKTSLPNIGRILWARKPLHLKARYESPAWNIYLFRKLSAIEALPIQLLYDLATYLTLSILVLLLISTRFSRRLAAPIEQLIRATKKISHGQLDQSVSVNTGDEIEDLAQSFNQMSRVLQETTVSRDYLENILSSMTEGLMILSEDNKIRQVNREFVKLVGYREGELMGREANLVFKNSNLQTRLHEEILEKGQIERREVNFQTKDGSTVPVLYSGSTIHDNHGELSAIACVATDISELKKVRKTLRSTIREKETLLQEIHHRVKNNMEIVSSMLGLQAEDIDDEELETNLNQARTRINTMGLIHKQLYREKNIHNIDLENYLSRLLRFLKSSYSNSVRKLDFDIDVENVEFGINESLYCGLIIQELVTNSIKYGFKDREEGAIKIQVSRSGESNTIIYEDDGTGLPENYSLDSESSFGTRLIRILVEKQLDGSIDFDTEVEGTRFIIRF